MQVELKADAVCKNGMPYPQRYAWAMRFDQKGIIVQASLGCTVHALIAADFCPKVRAYLDSALVQKAVDENTS